MAISVRGSGDTSAMKKKNGVGTGSTRLENLTVSGTTTVATPVNDTDAVTKKYVDDALENVIYGEGEGTIEDAEIVQSVNGKTGVVTLKTSDLTNDSGYITADEVPSGLPTVTTEDASKVLMVNDSGEWAAADLESDIAVVKPNDCLTEEGKTRLNQVHADYIAGKYKTVILIDDSGVFLSSIVENTFASLLYADTSEMVFYALTVQSNQLLEMRLLSWKIAEQSWYMARPGNEEYNYSLCNFYGLPEPSTAEAGKVVQISSDGQWVAAEIEIPEVTVDSALSTTSENPVQNKVIDAALKALELVATDDGDGNVTLSIS